MCVAQFWPRDAMNTGFGDERLIFPATERNRMPIGTALAHHLPPTGLVLEVASGSGEHGVAFQQRFPSLTWQCSDPDPEHCRSINAWIRHEGLDDAMPPALQLDVRDSVWPCSGDRSPVAIVAINLLHISAWECTVALFQQSARILPAGGTLNIYGPFSVNGQHVSDSNRSFDVSLRERNPLWGVRDQTEVIDQAIRTGLSLVAIEPLPANNRMITLAR